MGDITLAEDVKEGVADIMSEVGSTHTFRIIEYSAPSPTNPGAAPTQTIDDTDIEAYTFDFIQEYMPTANVLEGELMGILSIAPLTEEQISKIKPGTELIELPAPYTETYKIVKSDLIRIAGIGATAIVQLKK
jgi:hypothetical protein